MPPCISWAQQRKIFPIVKLSLNHSNLSSFWWFYFHSGSKFLDLLLLSNQSALYICIITSVCLTMCHCEPLFPLRGYEFLSATISKKSGRCLEQNRIWSFVSTFEWNIPMMCGTDVFSHSQTMMGQHSPHVWKTRLRKGYYGMALV